MRARAVKTVLVLSGFEAFGVGTGIGRPCKGVEWGRGNRAQLLPRGDGAGGRESSEKQSCQGPGHQ